MKLPSSQFDEMTNGFRKLVLVNIITHESFDVFQLCEVVNRRQARNGELTGDVKSQRTNRSKQLFLDGIKANLEYMLVHSSMRFIAEYLSQKGIVSDGREWLRGLAEGDMASIENVLKDNAKAAKVEASHTETAAVMTNGVYDFEDRADAMKRGGFFRKHGKAISEAFSEYDIDLFRIFKADQDQFREVRMRLFNAVNGSISFTLTEEERKACALTKADMSFS